MLKLKRFHETPKRTLGILTLDKTFLCYTLELPWKQNARNISSIPIGSYELLRHSSPRHGFSFWLQNVPNRSEILIHAGNSTDNTRGCILVGTELSETRTRNSQQSMRRLEQILKQPYTLNITN